MHDPGCTPTGRPPCRQPDSPPHLSCRLAFLWLRVKLLSHPQRGPFSSPVCPPPSCQRTHLSPIPGHQPWVSVPSCPLLAPQYPVLRLPAVTMEGIWYETNKKTKTKLDICNYLSVCTCRSSPAIRGPVRAAMGQGQPGGRPITVLCPDGWPCCCLFLAFYFLISSFF